mmetsp:Transcript_40623/g.86528  ORF Transcript_40623/g.86528 Transcript_40623/m.86528 type:complete len:298 (-) Transcript_40623:29-922(-)
MIVVVMIVVVMIVVVMIVVVVVMIVVAIMVVAMAAVGAKATAFERALRPDHGRRGRHAALPRGRGEFVRRHDDGRLPRQLLDLDEVLPRQLRESLQLVRDGIDDEEGEVPRRAVRRHQQGLLGVQGGEGEALPRVQVRDDGVGRHAGGGLDDVDLEEGAVSPLGQGPPRPPPGILDDGLQGEAGAGDAEGVLRAEVGGDVLFRVDEVEAVVEAATREGGLVGADEARRVEAPQARARQAQGGGDGVEVFHVGVRFRGALYRCLFGLVVWQLSEGGGGGGGRFYPPMKARFQLQDEKL